MYLRNEPVIGNLQKKKKERKFMMVIPKKLDNGSVGPYISSRGQPKSHEDHISVIGES